MQELREGIGLRGYGQRDPLVEYKEEAYHIFQRLITSIENQVVEMLLKLEIRQQPQQQIVQSARPLEMKGADESLAGGGIQQPIQQSQPSAIQSTNVGGVTVSVRQRGDQASGSSTTQTSIYPKVGRNEPCPCGSGKKYKKCHGR